MTMPLTDTVQDDHYRPRDPNHQATPSGELHAPHDGHGEHHVHVTSLRLLASVLAMLLLLTVLTVAVTWVDLGDLNIWIALLIAVVKAVLVALYFMHLRWDAPFNALSFAAAVVFLALFIGISLMDTAEYQPVLETPGPPQVAAQPDVE